MSALPKEKLYTPEEYLAFERKAEEMSEFHQGKIVSRASSAIDHARIMSNFISELGQNVSGLRHRVFPVGLKVRTKNSDYFLYPDILVLNSKPVFHDKERDVIRNPILVVEIYSRETSHFDRNEKFIIYQSFASIEEIAFISQYQPIIQTFYRSDNNSWKCKQATGLDSLVKFDSIKAAVKLEKIYDLVEF